MITKVLVKIFQKTGKNKLQIQREFLEEIRVKMNLPENSSNKV
jgi:hypothetical protein